MARRSPFSPVAAGCGQHTTSPVVAEVWEHPSAHCHLATTTAELWGAALGRGLCGHGGRELPTGGHAQFSEDLAQVVLDGRGGDEQSAGDFGVGHPDAGLARDLRFLGSEVKRVMRARRVSFGVTRGPLL